MFQCMASVDYMSECPWGYQYVRVHGSICHQCMNDCLNGKMLSCVVKRMEWLVRLESIL